MKGCQLVGESGQCWPFFIFEQLWSVHSFSAYMCISLPVPDDREPAPPQPADPKTDSGKDQDPAQ